MSIVSAFTLGTCKDHDVGLSPIGSKELIQFVLVLVDLNLMVLRSEWVLQHLDYFP